MGVHNLGTQVVRHGVHNLGTSWVVRYGVWYSFHGVLLCTQGPNPIPYYCVLPPPRTTRVVPGCYPWRTNRGGGTQALPHPVLPARTAPIPYCLPVLPPSRTTQCTPPSRTTVLPVILPER